MAVDVSSLRMFVAIAETGSFRLAAEHLGVTRPAVSQGLRRLEDSLGVALIERTTRSVRVTSAGARLHSAAKATFNDFERAIEDVRAEGSGPTGTLRLTVSSIAESFLKVSTLGGFLDAHPDVALDITISDDTGDIVQAGYDAGVRLGELIERDMVAIPVSAKQRQLVVGAPSYFEHHTPPVHPRELAEHACIGWRPHPDSAPYRWEFTERGRDFEVAVNPRVTTNDMAVMLRFACAGMGLTFGMEETFRPYVDSGELHAILQDFSAPFPGFYLYYPKRGHPPHRLRALVEYLQRTRRAERSAARK
jgi:DNA-binding transcriptional LysR family regulator